jgi:hypothetical protein
MPRCVSRASLILADARSSRVHLLRTLRCSEDCPTTVPRPLRTATPRARLSTLTSCSPSRCLRPRSSFDARVRRRSGVSSVVRLPLSRQTSLGSRPSRSRPRAPGRVHLPVLAVLASRRTRATLHRLTVHGLANSCHVSTRAGGDPLPFEDRARTSHSAIAPALAFRRWRLPGRRPCDPCMPFDIHVPQPPHDDPFGPPLCLHSPVLRDRFPLLPDRSASLDAHDPPALPCSRSRNVFVGCRVALPTPCPSCDVHVRDALRDPRPRTCSVTSQSIPPPFGFSIVDAVTCQSRHLETPGTFRHQPSRNVEHLSSSNTFRRQTSRGAA